jgi:hypothetical protein
MVAIAAKSTNSSYCYHKRSCYAVDIGDKVDVNWKPHPKKMDEHVLELKCIVCVLNQGKPPDVGNPGMDSENSILENQFMHYDNDTHCCHTHGNELMI